MAMIVMMGVKRSGRIGWLIWRGNLGLWEPKRCWRKTDVGLIMMPGYDGRFLFVTALRELQEERRALEPSGVVTTNLGFLHRRLQSSIQTHVTSEFYSSTVRSTTGSRTSSINVADLSKTMTRSRTSILRNPKSGRSQPSVAEESLQ